MWRTAPSSNNVLATWIAGDSRVSPVFFLKAKPSMAILLSVTVLKRDSMTFAENLDFWYSFISITCCQYAATSGRFKHSQMYTKFKMSFWKQEPPKPTDAWRNLEPIRESSPIARATSDTSAPVASHTADNEFILEMRWARKAFAAWNENEYKWTIYFLTLYKFN